MSFYRARIALSKGRTAIFHFRKLQVLVAVFWECFTSALLPFYAVSIIFNIFVSSATLILFHATLEKEFLGIMTKIFVLWNTETVCLFTLLRKIGENCDKTVHRLKRGLISRKSGRDRLLMSQLRSIPPLHVKFGVLFTAKSDTILYFYLILAQNIVSLIVFCR
jgi:hypothetical protein